ACGGLGTPRLLLLSTSPRHRHGLANGSGLGGRNLMGHVQSYIVGRFAERLGGWGGALGGAGSAPPVFEAGPGRGVPRGFIMTGCHGISPLDLALQVAPWGESHHAAVDRHLNHELGIYLCGEDLPEPENRVELEWSQVDEHGLPGVSTHYTLSENSRH